MTTKFGKQVHLGEIDSNDTSEAGAGDVVTSRLRDKLKHETKLYLYYHSPLGHPTWQDGD